MSTRHASTAAEVVLALDLTQPGDTLYLHAGTYEIALDSYSLPMRGGTTWSNRTRILAWRNERPVLRPTSGDFAIRLAHPDNSYLEIAGLAIDARALPTSGSATGIKVTHIGLDPSNCAHHVRLRNMHVYGAYHHGMLVTGTHHVEIIGGSASYCGRDLVPENANKDHGLYLGAGTWDCLVQDFDTYCNAAYGICEYGGESPDLLGRNVIRRGFHYENGRLARRAGVLLSGTESRCERVMSTANEYGIEEYRTARRCKIVDCYTEGNTQRGLLVSPEAT